MKKTLLSLGLCLLAATSSQANESKLDPNLLASTIAEEQSKNMPAKVDKMTTLNSAFAQGSEVIVTATISNEGLESQLGLNKDAWRELPKEQKKYILNVLQKELSKLQTNMLCSSPGIDDVFGIGVSVNYKYYDSDAKYLVETTINKESCDNLK